MRKIAISGALLALLAAAPALAQDNNDRHHEGGQGGAPNGAMSAQHPDRNPNHGNMGGGANDGGVGGVHHGATQHTPAQPTAHVAPQQVQQSNPAVVQNNNNHNNNDHRGDRSGNNRPGDYHPNNTYHGGMAGPGNSMAGPNRNTNRYNGNNGPRVTNFNSYHRNFTAPRRYHAPARYHRPNGWYSHRWTYGERLPPAFFVRDYWIDDYFDFGLVAPPYGTTWVRYGDDALLIDEYTGEVIQVAYGVFY